MKYLFIDTTTSNLIVAIIDQNKIIYNYNQEIGKNMSNEVLPIIKQAFEQVSLDPKEINKIFAVNGPGSFTGIRVGLTVAKTIAWALKIPIIPISSLEVIASTPNQGNNIAVIDARRGYVFAGIYDEKLNIVKEDSYILFSEIKEKGTIVSYDDYKQISPQIDILKIIKKHENESGENPHKINPKYLKLTEAEEKLNKQNDQTN